VSAILMEISEEWETGRVYMAFDENWALCVPERYMAFLQKECCAIQEGDGTGKAFMVASTPYDPARRACRIAKDAAEGRGGSIPERIRLPGCISNSWRECPYPGL